jgi:hypothetical protein
VYRLGGGRIIAENIVAHAITANEVAAETLTANEIAARTLTGDKMAMNTIMTKNLALGDLTNYATVNENIPASMLPAGTFLGQTLIDNGYITKGAAANQYLMFADFPEGMLQAGDEFYFEFSAKAAAATTGSMCVRGCSAVNRVNGVVTGATVIITYSSATLSLTTDERRMTGAIKATATEPVKYIAFGFENTGVKVQVYFKNVIIRKKNAGEMIVDGAIKTNHMEAGSIDADRLRARSITGNLIDANTVNAANLNVLAKNIVNPFVDGTSEGWTTSAPMVNVEDLGYVLKPTHPSAREFRSNIFEVLPDDLYVFKFGVESLTALTGSLGMYIGLTAGQVFNRYQYNFNTKKWDIYNYARTNAYFLENYIAAARSYFTTYILGSRVDIADVPAPVVTSTAYPVQCLQLTGTDTTCRIRSGFNGGQPEGTAWYFIQPRVYRIGSSKITAENIVTKDLSAISASLGLVTGGKLEMGSAEADNFWDLSTGEFRVGNARQLETNNSDEAEYLHYKPLQGIFFKIKNFIVEALRSILWGEFKILRTGQSSAETRAVLHVNPGADPGTSEDNHAASEFRGAFRVKKSNNPNFPGCDDVVFEALPGGNVNVPGNLSSAGYHTDGEMSVDGSFVSTSFTKKFKTVDLSGLDQNLYYPVTVAIPLSQREKGFFEVIVHVYLNSGTNPSWSTHTKGFACFQHVLALADGWGTTFASTVCLGREARWTTGDTIPPVGWSQMGYSSTAVLWLRGGGKYFVWDNANAGWTIRTAAYTINEQTVQPQAAQVFTLDYGTIHANLSAQQVDVAGALNAGGNAAVQGNITAGGTLKAGTVVLPVLSADPSYPASGQIWVRS